MSCKRSNSALHAVCAAATRVASSPLFRMTVNPRSRSSTAWRVMSEQGAASKGENAPIVNCEASKSHIRTGVNLFSLSRTIWSSHIVRSGVAEHEPKSSLKHTPGVVLSVGPILGPMEHGGPTPQEMQQLDRCPASSTPHCSFTLRIWTDPVRYTHFT